MQAGLRATENYINIRNWVREITPSRNFGIEVDHTKVAYAAGGLAKLSGNPKNLQFIREVSGIAPLVELARNGTQQEKEYALMALGNVSNDPVAKPIVLEHGGVTLMVAVLTGKASGERHKTFALGALANLATDTTLRQAIPMADGLAPIIELGFNGTDVQKEYAAGALKNLAAERSNEAKIVDAGGIGALMALLRDGSDEHIGHSVGALRNLCVGGDPSMVAAVRDAGLTPLLIALARNGSTNNVQRSHAVGLLHRLHPPSRNEYAVLLAIYASVLAFFEWSTDYWMIYAALLILGNWYRAQGVMRPVVWLLTNRTFEPIRIRESPR